MSDQETAEALLALVMALILVVVGLGVLFFFVLIWWRIFAKTGYGGWMGLLMFIPIVSFVMLLVLAFSDWPVHRELRVLRERERYPPPVPER